MGRELGAIVRARWVRSWHARACALATLLMLASISGVPSLPVPPALMAGAQAPPDYMLDITAYVEVYMTERPMNVAHVYGTVSIGTSRLVTTTVALTVSCALTVSISPSSFRFEGSESGAFRMDVLVPWGTIPLTWEELWVTATFTSSGQEDVTLRDNSLIHIHKYDLLGLRIGPETRDVDPGKGIDLWLEVENPAGERLTITIIQPDPVEFMTITVEPSTIVLGPSSSVNVSVRVEVDRDSPSGPVEPRLWFEAMDDEGEQVHTQGYRFQVDVDYLGPPLSERLEVWACLGMVLLCVAIAATVLWLVVRRLRGRMRDRGARGR